jgi:osmotically-inducible protein OsmY
MAPVLDQVRAALQSEPRLDLQRFQVALSYAEGTFTLEGEVGDIAAMKLALERAAAVPGVAGIVDRLRVQPAQRMGDGAIRDHLRDAWLQEPAFADFAIRVRVAGRVESIREPAAARGALELEVADGVATLNGQVPGLDDKRLAGVLAWWVPGSRDVINGIAVEPPEDATWWWSSLPTTRHRTGLIHRSAERTSGTASTSSSVRRVRSRMRSTSTSLQHSGGAKPSTPAAKARMISPSA